MAGLLDQYTYAGNSKTLGMVTWMAEYFANRVKNVIQKYSIERHYRSLNEETGGINDVLYRLYTITVCFLCYVPAPSELLSYGQVQDWHILLGSMVAVVLHQ